jgi:cyclopropane fatty-acyl-phospholipid synthase-like methyltransferase
MHNPYDLIAEQWHTSSREFRQQKYVDRLLQGVQPNALILDLGCGTGWPVAHYLVGQGFRVVGVDSSAKMLEIARQVVPEAKLIHGDMIDLELTERFSAAVVWDSVFHVERVHHPALFHKLCRWLAPGGRLLLSAGGSGDEGFTSQMHGHTFFYSGYEPEETLEYLRAAGFDVELSEVDDPSSRGHIAIIARRPTYQL